MATLVLRTNKFGTGAQFCVPPVSLRRASCQSRSMMRVMSTMQAPDVSANSIVMEPIRESGKDVLLVFAPGALTPASDYLPLGNEFQAASNFRLWITIIDPPDNIISTEIVEASFHGILQRAKSLGFKPGRLPMDNVFLAGHSWGAWCSRSVALRRTQAFIQMGSCFHTNPDNLSQHPKHVLTLNGELDGQLTLCATAKHAGEIFSVEDGMGSFNTYGAKPVILVPGMNHAQFSHGIPNKGRGDLDAEISIEDARRTVGQLVAAFLTVQLEQAGSPAASSALAKLEEAVRRTQALCKPYWEAIELQGKDGVKKYQLELAGLREELLSEANVAVVEQDYEDNFVYSKPWIDLRQQPTKVFVQTHLHAYGKYGIIRSLWIKMKSREAVRAALGEEDAGNDELGREAAGLNEKAFTAALEQVPESVKNKYLAKGKKAKFLDDLVITDSATKWIESDVMFTTTEEFVEVQSPVLISPLEGFAPRFAGMHYMKLLTVAGAMEIIFTDCFR